MNSLISNTLAKSNSTNYCSYKPNWESLSKKNATPQWYEDFLHNFDFEGKAERREDIDQNKLEHLKGEEWRK